MNQKQFIAMWGGITAIVLAGLNVIWYYGLVYFYGFFTWVLIVTLVTAGLIYSFKNKSGRKVENTIQNIRGTMLRKKQARMKTNDYDKDKQLARSGSHIQ